MTWINHYTAPLLLAEGEAASSIDVVGVDGTLLSSALGGVTRTSADLVVPLLLPALGNCRLALVGGTSETLRLAEIALTRLAPVVNTVAAVPGLEGRPTPRELVTELRVQRAEVCIIGLGGGLQDRYAAAVRNAGAATLTLTCGGFLDQVAYPRYYPSWAYALRLNWAVRLAREPARLWRRYTIDAARFVGRRSRYVRAIENLPGFRRYRQLFES